MWLYKAALFSLLVGKLSYIQTLDEKRLVVQAKQRIWCEKHSNSTFLGNI